MLSVQLRHVIGASGAPPVFQLLASKEEGALGSLDGALSGLSGPGPSPRLRAGAVPQGRFHSRAPTASSTKPSPLAAGGSCQGNSAEEAEPRSPSPEVSICWETQA